MPNTDVETPADPQTPDVQSASEAGGCDASLNDAVHGEVIEGEVIDGEVIDGEVIELQPLQSAEELLSEKLKSTEARLRTVSKAYTDLQAEMKAFRARVELQGQAKSNNRVAGIVGVLLSPVDNLRRSITSPGDDVAALVDGLKLIEQQFTAAMTKAGLRQIEGVGAFFNPKHHEALAMTPVTDAKLDGRILMVHNTGYALGDTVLQPAQVIVGKMETPAPEPASADEPAAEPEPTDEADHAADES